MGYKIEWCKDCIHIKYDGEVNLNDIIGVNRLISRDSRYNYLKCQISDFSQVKKLIMSEKDIEMLSSFHVIPSMVNSNLKLSVISDNRDIQEKASLYIDFMKDLEWRVKLFNNLEESKEWCNPD